MAALTQQAMRAVRAVAQPHGFNIGMNQGAGRRAPASRPTCTSTSSRAGAATRTSCRSWLAPRLCPSCWATPASASPTPGRRRTPSSDQAPVRAAGTPGSGVGDVLVHIGRDVCRHRLVAQVAALERACAVARSSAGRRRSGSSRSAAPRRASTLRPAPTGSVPVTRPRRVGQVAHHRADVLVGDDAPSTSSTGSSSATVGGLGRLLAAPARRRSGRPCRRSPPSAPCRRPA